MWRAPSVRIASRPYFAQCREVAMAEVHTPRCSETIDLEECLAAKTGAGDHGTLIAALAYAERGWAVFPCQGKHPLTKHGCKDATTDAAAFRRFWQRFPPPNIGLAT